MSKRRRPARAKDSPRRKTGSSSSSEDTALPRAPIVYTINVTPAAQRDLRGLDQQILRRVDDEIRKLAEDSRPADAKKLTGGDGEYRVRVGDYRIVYMVEDANLVVLVIRVRHRREVYR